MTSTFGIINRFAEEAGKPNPRFLRSKGLNVFAGREGGRDAVYSYGYHFPMAVLMPDENGEARGWWLVNGDKYSISTSQHQNGVRSALNRTGLPMVIIPFSALREAGIDTNTIERIEVLPDRYTWEQRTRDDAPKDWELNTSGAGGDYAKDFTELPDGRWAYLASVHHLGESLFKATYAERVPGTYRDERKTGWFLSAFDENEPRGGLYFLAQLPEIMIKVPETVAEARQALKPGRVKRAENQGREVLRQGDVFAIPTDWQTKALPGPSLRSAYVLEVNHIATEVRVAGDRTYARGFLRHRPRETWRRPEHRAVKLGDGKTWYLLVKNTVPEGRSWSVGGNVD